MFLQVLKSKQAVFGEYQMGILRVFLRWMELSHLLMVGFYEFHLRKLED